MTRQNNGNGTYVLNTFDAAGRMTLLENKKSDNSLLSSFAYTMDNVGNRLSITESVLGTDNTTYQNATVNYGYDNIYRLTSEHRTGATPFWYEYSYDGAGNRLALVQKDGSGNVTGTTNSTYDAANKLLTSGNITYTWDANGNQTSKTVNGQTTTYTWDYEDKMTTLTSPGATMNFATAGEGFRRSLSDGTATTRFVYDRSRAKGTPGIDPLILETDATGTSTTRYGYANRLLSQTRGGTTSWYSFEGIGSSRQVTDSSQSVTDGYGYDAWGNQLTTNQLTTNPFRYIGTYGYYCDGQTGLYLLGVRYYDNVTGRFQTQDPVRDGVNLWLYGRSNPVTRIDPLGLRVIYPGDDLPPSPGPNKDTWPVPPVPIGSWCMPIYCWSNTIVQGDWEYTGGGEGSGQCLCHFERPCLKQIQCLWMCFWYGGQITTETSKGDPWNSPCKLTKPATLPLTFGPVDFNCDMFSCDDQCRGLWLPR